MILECLPTILTHVKRRVEHDAMRVQVRIEHARRVMREQGGSKVPGQTVALRPTDSHARCRERLKLSQCQIHGAVVSFKNPFVLTHQSRNGNRLRRGESEVEEYPPIGCVLSAFRPRCI